MHEPRPHDKPGPAKPEIHKDVHSVAGMVDGMVGPHPADFVLEAVHPVIQEISANKYQHPRPPLAHIEGVDAPLVDEDIESREDEDHHRLGNRPANGNANRRSRFSRAIFLVPHKLAPHDLAEHQQQKYGQQFRIADDDRIWAIAENVRGVSHLEASPYKYPNPNVYRPAQLVTSWRT